MIWIHAVSFGEMKAASTLIPHIRKTHPEAKIALSTVTETGYKLAKTLIPEAALHFRLPFDWPWTMRALAKKIKPTLLILVEGDYWPNMLYAAKAQGAKIFVVSGKMSARSLKWYKWIPWLFKPVDHFFLQNALYEERFRSLGFHNVTVTGNLKFDLHPSLTPLTFPGEWITLGSTHPGEEVALLEALQPLLKERPSLSVFVAPRHPERFDEVRKLLLSYQRVHLVDQMGVLPSYYAHSKLAVVGGSFVSHLGGHDVLEPVRLGVPVLFGPYMHTQLELKKRVEEGGVGEGCELTSLAERAAFYLDHPVKEAIKQALEGLSGASFLTWEKIACDLKRD